MKTIEFLSFSISLKMIILQLLMFVAFQNMNIAQEEEEHKRGQLFWDRVYPTDTMSISSMINSLSYDQTLTQMNGYYLQQLFWSSIGPQPYIYDNDNTYRAGRVVSVKYYPYVPGHTAHPDWMYIIGHDGGVWKSEDYGTSFLPISDQLLTQSSGCLAFDPNNPDIIYYGTGGDLYNFSFNGYGIGVYKSTNAGVSWNGPYRVVHPDGPLTGMPILTTIFKITVDPQNSNNVYLAEGHDSFYGPYHGGGLYKSTDGGVTWAIAPGTPLDKGCNDVVIFYDGETQTKKIYAAGIGEFGYWISTNNGNNFTQVTNNGFSQGRRTQLAMPSINSNIIYAVSVFDNYPTPNDPGGVWGFISTDGGTTFTPRLIYNGFSFGPLMAATMTFVQACPYDPQTAIVGFGAA